MDVEYIDLLRLHQPWEDFIGAYQASRNSEHILENITIFDFELTDEEMQRIAALETGNPAYDFRDVTEQSSFDFFTPPAGSTGGE